jgi:hypothetical protein
MKTDTELVAADLSMLSNHDLLAGGLDDELRMNFYAAQRLARLEEYRRRMEADVKARKAAEPHFTMTPIRETVVEAGELWGVSEGRVRGNLSTSRTLQEHFLGIWQLFLTGALDPHKASLIADTAKFSLDRPSEFARFAERLTAWLIRRIPDHDPSRPRLVNCTMKQLRNKLNYEVKKLKSRKDEKRFKQAFADRKAQATLGDDGMGWLNIGNTVTDVQLADHRLTLIAKALRAQGDERTIEQLRADLAIDLIAGRVAVDATNAELEEEERDGEGASTGEGKKTPVRRLPTLNYARPILAVTVPIQTLMGVSDHPGMLSGGTTIPASLARRIAADKDSTWFRMLTDERNQCVELSTKSYRPTKEIWRDVVLRYGTCYRNNCDRAATGCELDHLEEFPAGPTSNENLGPACKPDHTAKHAPGFGVEKNDDGTLTLHTRAGFSHRTQPTEQPAITNWPDLRSWESQYTAAEIVDAIAHLAVRDETMNDGPSCCLDEEDRWFLDHAYAA